MSALRGTARLEIRHNPYHRTFTEKPREGGLANFSGLGERLVGERIAQVETRHRPGRSTLSRHPNTPVMVIRMNLYKDEAGRPMPARVGTWYLQLHNH